MSLARLQVIKELVVGPPIVEPKRVKTPYKVIHLDGQSSSTELIYSFDERVFDPDERDLNLASVMTAQVALNYGLFAQQVVLDGVFDDADKAFLSEMLENTAREIYLNKLLVENKFLTDEFRDLSPEPVEKLVPDRLQFRNTRQGFDRKLKPDRDDDNRENDGPPNPSFLVLSSGGKDSLLTYGLLKEIGLPTHPIFINESGRHWYTALNAFRYLEKNEPHTARVWCNCDRVFSWMLRQLKLIRPNFADIRSDYYPIRLWTVAVFLFGVLPLARKRGLNRILIGNEYDTTVKKTTHGFPNYHGLYDQSIYFDRRLCRYYRAKGWMMEQYSILRPLSELLILKILAVRYPELQQHQVSCHAAHEHAGRILPCGRCEKCRRICGMLMALDRSPENCGYSSDQVQRLLKELAEFPLKQLGTDQAHLLWLLQQKELIDNTEYVRRKARQYNQIECLRFDFRSSLDDVSKDFGTALLDIMLDESQGAVERKNDRWQEYSPIEQLT